jgi:hypothetical protein
MAALVLGAGAREARAQTAAPREVVAKEVDVSRTSAALRLGFADQGELELELSDGTVALDGEEIGSYQAGDALDTAWRALLGEAVTLEDGPLAQRLIDWTPPTGLPAAASAVAARIDGALAEALSGAAAPGFAQSLAAAGSERALRELLERPEQMLQLARAIEGLELDDARVHVGENALVMEGETVDGSLVVVDGDLDVDGEVDGDAVVVGGTLRLGEEGRVTGDVRLADARLLRDGGEVLGEVSNLGDDPDEVRGLTESGRARLREEIRDELEAEQEAEQGDDRPFLGPVGRFAGAVGDVIELGLVILLIGVLGGGLAIHFAREELDVVAETARRNPLRAGVVGLAGAFLVIPAWALVTVALVITIVGILAVPFWVVLFPLAVAAALVLGYLAVAQQLGEWIARRRYAKLGWVQLANPYSTIIAGVGTLMLAFVAARMLDAVGLLGWMSVLLTVLGILATAAAALIGFGAVLLSRAGTRTAYAGGGRYWGSSWEDDLGFGASAHSAGDSPPQPPPTGPGEI